MGGGRKRRKRRQRQGSASTRSPRQASVTRPRSKRPSGRAIAINSLVVAIISAVFGAGQFVTSVIALRGEPPLTTTPGHVIGGTLTDDERMMVQLMDPKDGARYLLQKQIATSVIYNIR